MNRPLFNSIVHGLVFSSYGKVTHKCTYTYVYPIKLIHMYWCKKIKNKTPCCLAIVALYVTYPNSENPIFWNCASHNAPKSKNGNVLRQYCTQIARICARNLAGRMATVSRSFVALRQMTNERRGTIHCLGRRDRNIGFMSHDDEFVFFCETRAPTRRVVPFGLSSFVYYYTFSRIGNLHSFQQIGRANLGSVI